MALCSSAPAAAGSMEASQFTNLVADGKIDDAMVMTAKPVTREDVEKLAEDLKTWGKPGPFTAPPGSIPVITPDEKGASMTYKGTVKFENAVKKYSFTLTVPSGVAPAKAKQPAYPKEPLKNSGAKITAFKFE